MDARAALARQAHRYALQQDRDAAVQREARDRLVRQLREEDPVLWTYVSLARAVGCSPELIRDIVKRPAQLPSDTP